MSNPDMIAKAILSFLMLLVPFAPGTASPTLEQKIIHLLNRIAFGARPGDIEQVKNAGIDRYIDQQLAPMLIDDSAALARTSDLESLRMQPSEIFARYPRPQDLARQMGFSSLNSIEDPQERRQRARTLARDRGLKPPQELLHELQAQKIILAVHSERQLQEVMTDFWFNHFNVFWGKGLDRWLTAGYETHAIRPHVLGKFKDLLMATAKSPAMLFYLDNHLSLAPAPVEERARRRAPQRQRGINENYARELLELHTMGVDGGYTQRDIREVARAFTGWTIDRAGRQGTFIFRPEMHDDGEKVVLGHKLIAGGLRDGEDVINILARHPSTARFISTKLVRKFVSDNPPQTLVDRVAAVYRSTGGDIREMLRTILKSPEFYGPETIQAKIKSPFELAISAIRALNGSTNGSRQLTETIARMGQPLYQFQPPTGFPDRGDYWISQGSTLERLNFAVALSAGRVRGVTIDSGSADAKTLAVMLGSPEFQKR